MLFFNRMLSGQVHMAQARLLSTGIFTEILTCLTLLLPLLLEQLCFPGLITHIMSCLSTVFGDVCEYRTYHPPLPHNFVGSNINFLELLNIYDALQHWGRHSAGSSVWICDNMAAVYTLTYFSACMPRSQHGSPQHFVHFWSDFTFNSMSNKFQVASITRLTVYHVESRFGVC